MNTEDSGQSSVGIDDNDTLGNIQALKSGGESSLKSYVNNKPNANQYSTLPVKQVSPQHAAKPRRNNSIKSISQSIKS